MSESLEILDAKIGSVPVRCVVASLACPVTSMGKNAKGLKIPCTPLASADRVATSISLNRKSGYPSK